MSSTPIPIKEKLYHLFNETDLIATRFMLSLGSLFWGAMLLFPGETFSRPMFTVLSEVMPEIFWGILFLISGFAGLYSLFCGYVKKILIVIDSLLGCFLWTSITIGMLLSAFTVGNNSSAPAAASPAIVLAMESWWILIRYPIFKK